MAGGGRVKAGSERERLMSRAFNEYERDEERRLMGELDIMVVGVGGGDVRCRASMAMNPMWVDECSNRRQAERKRHIILMRIVPTGAAP